MQNKKVTMLAAVLAVTIIAMAGVGYALDYTAKTVNSNNSMDQTYITMSQDGTGKYATVGFLKDLYFDTVTDASTTTYTPVYTYVKGTNAFTEPAEGQTADAAVASGALTLYIGQKNNESSIDLTVTASSFYTNGMTYWMSVTANGETAFQNIDDYGADGWVFTGIDLKDDDAVTTLTIQLFVTGQASSTWNDIENAEFTFVATATA